jgi:broad specificity phosphatase PhoE
MNGRRAVFLAALLASTAQTARVQAQQAVFVVRHAEKISEADERLTEAGRARADRLAKMLKDAGIAAIYSTDTERTIGTAQPLADALRRKIRIYDAIPPLVERLRRENPRDVVLVVGHSNTLGPILTALGCAETITIASDEYDNLFLVLPREGGKATLIRLRD